MLKLTYILISLCVFSSLAIGQNNGGDFQVTNDGGEVAREGRVFSYTLNAQENDHYVLKIHTGDSSLACINGAVKPPFKCKDYFTEKYEVENNTLYLYTQTVIRYKSAHEFVKKNVPARLKISAQSGNNVFKEEKNAIILPVSGDFTIVVVMELFGPDDVEWIKPEYKSKYAGKWAPVLDVYDAMCTDPEYRIFTSFDEAEMEFYKIEK